MVDNKDLKKVVSWCFFGKKTTKTEITDLVESVGWNMRRNTNLSYMGVINHFTDFIVDNCLMDEYDPDINLATYVLNVLYDLFTKDEVEKKKVEIENF